MLHQAVYKLLNVIGLVLEKFESDSSNHNISTTTSYTDLKVVTEILPIRDFAAAEALLPRHPN
jgi:uncharacterized membrane protein (UPF0182 family)